MDYYNLSNPQKAIWSIEEFYKGTNINNICATLTIKQDVDLDVLDKAINVFVQNNKSYGLNLKEQDGNIVQYFTKQDTENFERVYLKDYKEVQKLANEVSENPFDIYGKKLYKFILYKLDNGYGGFIVLSHHIISDAGTFALVGTEIPDNYWRILNNEEIEQKDYSYKDYLNDEKEYMISSKFKKDEEYWNNLYKTIPEIASIPSFKAKNSTDLIGKANRKEFILDKELLHEISEFCKSNKISSFNFFMAIYAIYLARVSNLMDFAIGTPILNRSNFKEKHTAGMFINTAALRITLNNDIAFTSLAKQIAQSSLSMLRYQKYPYEMLLQNLRKSDNNLPNLYDVMLSYQVTKANDKNSDIPYEVEWLGTSTISNSMYIHLHDNNDDESLNIAYDYQIQKYDDKDIENIHKRILYIIKQVLENENILEKDIEILSVQEKDNILSEFNNTFLDYDVNKTVIDYFEDQVKETPDSIALIFENQSFTYDELNRKANQLGKYLIKNGVKPQDVVGIMVHRSPEMIISILAVLKISATYLPIDPEYPMDRVNYMLENSNTKTVLVHKATLDLDIKSNCKKINVDLDLDIFKSNDYENINFPINSSGLIYLIYTSGSTGKPKGVMISHKNITNFILGEKKHINFSKDKTMVSVTTFCFDIFALEIWGALTSGMKLVLASDIEQLSPIPLKELCKKNHVNMIQTTPSRFSILFAVTENTDFWNQFSDIMVGGEPFPKVLLEKLQKHTKANIFNMYGPTETTVWSTIKDLSNTSDITVGKPIANTTCYILDKNKKLLPPGIAGELYIGGDGVSAGYWNRKELTDEKFIKSPFKAGEIIYDTGDLAYINEQNEIVHLGRTDFQVKIRGHRIELGEIENKLLELPNITDCVVNPVDNSSKLCAYYISATEINISELRACLSKVLPNYMVPNYFIKMEAFPHTPNGKIDKKALPLPKANTNKKTLEYRNEIDKYLIDEITILLDSDNVNINDSFFDIGGDSLTAIKLCTKISSKYKINFAVQDIFDNPIIKDISDKITSETNNNSSFTIKKVSDKDFYHLSSAQKRIYYSSKISGESMALYNLPGYIIFDKKPDIKKLNDSFNKLIERHSSLRTYFEEIDEEVFQKVANSISFKIDEITENTKSIEEIIKDFVKPFDLSKAPLLRAVLIKQNSKYLLLFDIHHIICDGTSLSIFTKELSNIYNEKTLNKLNFDYTDYAEWEFEELKNNNLSEHKDFWINQFKDDLPVLDFPTDFVRPNVQSFEGEKVYKTIDKELSKEIFSLSKKLNVSAFMLLLSAYYILLAKYTNQEDIVCRNSCN